MKKLWRIRSKDFEEVFWIRAKTKPEAKKILRKYLHSTDYWGNEAQTEYASEIFKSYDDIMDCPGIKVDETRGDLMTSLVNSATDFIMPDDKKSG